MHIQEYVQQCGEELKQIVDPIMEKDYPDFTAEDRAVFWYNLYGSFANWCIFMNKFIVPQKDAIFSLDLLSPTIKLPQIIPGLTLKETHPSIVRKVVSLLTIYLNLWEWCKKANE